MPLTVVDVDPAAARELAEDAFRIVKSSAGSWPRVLAATAGRSRCLTTGRLPILLRGLPSWGGLETPASRSDADPAPRPADLVPLLVMAELGIPLAFASIQNGRPVQDVVATDAPLKTDAVEGRALELHIEAGFARFKPDHVGLYCLYNDDHVATTLSVLRPELIPPLVARALGSVRPTAILGRGDLSEHDPASAIVQRTPGQFRVNYDLGCFQYDLSTEQQEALDRLTRIIEGECRPVVLTQGDMVIWDNNTTIHGRDSYPLRFNGRDRWLKRVFTRRELDTVNDLLVDPSRNVFP